MTIPCHRRRLRYLLVYIAHLLIILHPTRVSSLPDEAYNPEECRPANGNASNPKFEYQGKVNVAFDGTPCLPWSHHPHFHRAYWPSARALRESNYCRNPDDDIHGPWCVVHKTSFKYCNVPRCANDIGCYEGKGEDYVGAQDRTVDGTPCKVWSHSNSIRMHRRLFQFRYYQNESYGVTLGPVDQRLEKFTSCRNPGGIKPRPWCYTAAHSGAKSDKIFCDIPKCSEPSTLGYVQFTNTTCALGFLPQFQTLQFGDGAVHTVNYCVAPYRLLHQLHRRSRYARFTDFCLYVIDKTSHCPAGFRRTRRFQANLYQIKPLSGPSAWQAVDDNLLQCAYCCSEADYFRNYTVQPYIKMEKVSSYKLSERTSNEGRLQAGLSLWDLDEAAENMTGDVFDIFGMADRLSEFSIAFASVRRCPPVANTTRLIHLGASGAAVDKDTSMLSMYPYMDEVLCEYYPVQTIAHTESSPEAIPRKLALFVSEPQCPGGFKTLFMPRQIMFVLGTSSRLCEPIGETQEPPTPSHESYCLPVVPDYVLTEDQEDTDLLWGRESVIQCPKGFRPNEIHFTNPNYRLKLCCSIVRNETTDNDSFANLQAPFEFKSVFGVIQNGDRCPTFYDGSVKLNVVQYIRQIPSQAIKTLELIGLDDPVKPSNFLGISVCQYLQPQVKLGVKALATDCEGLGHRSSMTFSGVTCGFDVNDGTVFQPGKYCLFQISSDCPPGFTQRSGMVRLGFALQPLDRTCCRTEESIGAIRLPVQLEAPFKLPAIHRPCQAIENFNVDAELHHCVYYPQGSTPQALLVWPRIVQRLTNASDPINDTVSTPKRCAIMPRKRMKLQHSQMERLTTLFFNIMQDQWLIYKRPRWTVKVADTGDVCFTELPWSQMPHATANGRSYCVFVFGSCPHTDFETLGAAPYMNAVICCSRPAESHWEETTKSHKTQPQLRSFVALGGPLAEDKQTLRDSTGTFVLPMSPNAYTSDSEKYTGCPQFVNLRLHRRVAEAMPSPVSLRSFSANELASLFNVTTMDSETFTNRTGIWTQSDTVYVIYCEYIAGKPGAQDTDGKSWPQANFAIPKPMGPCPKTSEPAVIRHRQDQNGFHYSQPIHLDGYFLQGSRNVWLNYCVFKGNAHTQSIFDEDARDEMPSGHYCVLRSRGYCPSGFEEGALNILEGPENVGSQNEEMIMMIHPDFPESQITPDIERVPLSVKGSAVKIDRLDYHFCCRADSVSVDSPIEGFSAEHGPFYLYRVGDKCQRVAGTRVTEEQICMDTPNRGDQSWWSLDRNRSWVPYSSKGLTPARIPFDSHCDVEINMCYYEADIPPDENLTLTAHNSGQWPKGFYALPNVHRTDLDRACPPGFTQRHLSLMAYQATFGDMRILPMSLGAYFIELIGHNNSMLNVHYCERDMPTIYLPNDATLPPIDTTVSYEELAAVWPRGDYCVLSTAPDHQCPPGLHRHARPIAELCCRNDNVKNPVPVNWPFFDDFFLFGTSDCLNIKDTHVERYLVRLTHPTTSISKQESEWDILCHYLPIEWVSEARAWPAGDYMLPIGRRSGLKTAMINTVEYVDELTKDHVPFGSDAIWNNATDGTERPSYHCPNTFERVRLTFVSKASEKRQLPSSDGSSITEYNVVATTAMEFCVHTNETSEAPLVNTWPAGDYCVFTINKECPPEMQATKEIPLKIPRFLLKSVDIVNEYGERVTNKHWHEDLQNHVVYFMQCCREDKSLMLRLPPSQDGFYLVSSGGLCSNIPGTLLDLEKVTSYLTLPLFSRQTQNVNDREMFLYRELVAQREGLMYLCYYHPLKQVDYSTTIAAAQVATTLNLTESDLEAISAICGCAKNAFCMPHKQAECMCKPGYYGDGRHVCREITPLTDGCADLCDPAAVCAERLEGGSFRKKKQLLSHVCICRPGYVGDGFTCQPSCVSRECQPFSRCIHNAVRGTTECECIEGTVASDGRCNLDMYKSIQQEKDLPQFLIHHDNCLSEENQNALRLLNPRRYLYLFAPTELIRTCHDMTAHIVVRTEPLSKSELKTATATQPLALRTENDTIIEVYPQNGTWVIDGHLAQRSVIRFVNGELYILSAPLKRTPYVPSKMAYHIVGVLLSLVLVIALCVGTYYFVIHRHVQIRGGLFSRGKFGRQSGGSVLVEYPDGDE